MIRLARPALLAFFLLLVGCSAHGNVSGAAAPTSGRPSTVATSDTPSPVSSATPVASTATAPATVSTSAPSPVPVLGRGMPITRGYGSVRPTTLNNGGDPTGIVTNVSWKSWGGSESVGTGMAYYDPSNVPVSQATKEQATVVAFDLGTCNGVYMYQAIEWYFPESGGSFNPASYLNVCSWTYHPPGGP